MTGPAEAIYVGHQDVDKKRQLYPVQEVRRARIIKAKKPAPRESGTARITQRHLKLSIRYEPPKPIKNQKKKCAKATEDAESTNKTTKEPSIKAIIEKVRAPVMLILHAIIKIQRLWRRIYAIKTYKTPMCAALVIQRMFRWCKFRNMYLDLRDILHHDRSPATLHLVRSL